MERIEHKSNYKKIFVKRSGLIFLSTLAFFTVSSCNVKNNDNVTNGQGGYESPVLPSFSDSVPVTGYNDTSIVDDGEFHIEDFMEQPFATDSGSVIGNDGNTESADTGSTGNTPAVSGTQSNGSANTESGELPNASTLETVVDDNVVYTSYRVKQGDMICYIAEDFGVTQDTIISVNSIKQSRLIQIGQYLKIPSMPGILYTVRSDNETVTEIAKKYDVDASKCSLVNHVVDSQPLPAGTTLFVPDAELDWVTRQEINGDLFSRPLKGGYYFSSYFGWRNSPFTGARTYHNGIDMAAPKGTSVYAALAGTVITAGWSNTYGNYIIISHHSGYKTLYGHLSEIDVKKGQVVYTTTRIGRVGSTGLSTGPHLHFTVFKNGVAVNPQNLWQ